MPKQGSFDGFELDCLPNRDDEINASIDRSLSALENAWTKHLQECTNLKAHHCDYREYTRTGDDILVGRSHTASVPVGECPPRRSSTVPWSSSSCPPSQRKSTESKSILSIVFIVALILFVYGSLLAYLALGHSAPPMSRCSANNHPAGSKPQMTKPLSASRFE